MPAIDETDESVEFNLKKNPHITLKNPKLYIHTYTARHTGGLLPYTPSCVLIYHVLNGQSFMILGGISLLSPLLKS